MNNKKLAIWIVALVAILGISVLVYPKLQESYEAAAPSAEAEPTAAAGPSPSAAPGVPDDPPKDTVPDFTVLDMNGSKVSLSDYFGKPIVLNFWATWCGPCKSELPAFDSAYAEHGDDISFLMVNLTDGIQYTVSGTKGFAAESGYKFPIYFDTENSAAYAYSVRSIPMTVFINADGTLMDYRIGAISEETLAGYINKMAGK